MGGTYPNPFPDDVYADTETVTLTDEQRRRAEAALEALDRRQISKPSDLVDWRGAPTPHERDAMALVDSHDIDDRCYGEGHYIWIRGEDITGYSRESVDYLKPHKLWSKLEWLLDGTFEIDHHRPPQLTSINGDLYVSTDGLHRSIALKAVGADRVRVRVKPCFISEPGYRYWCAHRDAGLLPPVEDIKKERETTREWKHRLRDAHRRPPQHYEPGPDGVVDRIRHLFS